MGIRSHLPQGGEPLFLMDGTAFLYRCFYANPGMKRADGFPTGAIFALGRILLRILKQERPQTLVFILDGKGPTFRHELYAPYKAQRTATPEPLIAQIEPITNLVRALGIPLVVSSGCEADDCIAGLAHKFKAERPVVIIGSDKDFKQCLAPGVVLWDPSGKGDKLTTLESFQAESGLTPAQWPDFQAVIGDSSDNIPGVPGVGPKTAEKIFADLPSLEAIRDGLEALPEKLRDKFKEHIEDIFLFRRLTTLDTGACAELELEDISLRPPSAEAVNAILREYDLRSLLREFMDFNGAGLSAPAPPQTGPAVAAKKAAPGNKDLPLFNLRSETLLPAPGLATPAPAASPATGQVAGQATGQVAGAGGPSRQGSLLDLGAAAPEISGEPALDCAVKDLPDCRQMAVALLPEDGGWLLALGQQEYRVAAGADPEGTAGALARYCRAAGRVVTPDVKALLSDARHQPTAWMDLPLKLWFDLGLAAYLLNPEERDYSWPRLARHGRVELGLAQASTLLEADEHGAEGPEATDGQGAFAGPTGLGPGRLALALADMYQERLRGAGLEALLYELELPLIPVLAGMERRGLLLDVHAFEAFLQEVEQDLTRLTQKIYGLAGGEFNIRSAQQLGDILFARLNLPKAGKTKGGALSTSQEALEKLAGKHEIVDTILDYRKLEKLRSTYLEPFPKLTDAAGRIHTSFNQMATATGRLSSSRPNLQNIPVRGEKGHRMRACFTAAPGNALISADYSQIELRVLAHLSQDSTLLTSFRAGEDIHARTAGLLYDKAPQDITPEERRNAKTINFGLIYGMGAQKLGRELHISLKEAQEFMARYFEKFETLAAFYEGIVATAREEGYVTTMSGRRRLIPDIASSNAQLASQARRQAINTVLQGSAADIIKLAMLKTHASQELKDLKAELVLQIHDELVLEAPMDTAKQAGLCLAALMAEATPGGRALLVPLTVDWGVGRNWGEAH